MNAGNARDAMTVTRPAAVWTIFAICIAVLLAAMAWVTAHTLRLEEQRLAAGQERELQERVRLALWRMDSAAGALVIAENSRPANHFKDFHAAGQAYTNTYQILPKGSVILPSPLLNSVPRHALLYCQLEPDGMLTSPQVPSGNNRDLAEQNYVSRDEIESAAGRLEMVRERLPNPAAKPAGDGRAAGAVAVDAWRTASPLSAEQLENGGEWISRSQSKDKTVAWTQEAQQQIKIRPSSEMVRQQAESAGIAVGEDDIAEPFEGVWRDGELFLLREAILDGRPVTQAVWLDAARIEEMLLSEIRNLLPAARLSPVADTADSSVAGSPSPGSSMLVPRLVTLPFRLHPGSVAATPVAFWSPMRRSLALAWSGALVAALAVGGLLAGIISLSERRAAFVSAVTHEMRTPLTTFRLYSEMLAGDLIQDPARRRNYLTTLSSEASRLSHLVENVLAYARLEKGSARAQVEEIPLQAVVERVLPRLGQRAAQALMRIETDVAPSAAATRIKVDLTAVEQILFNLVDNACKYARPEEDADRVIHLEADTDGPMALLRVRDHGRGISTAEERRLFRPFEKSAEQAAHSAPGVGLGLALCRRLARALGGDLRLCRKGSGGCFVVAFPRA